MGTGYQKSYDDDEEVNECMLSFIAQLDPKGLQSRRVTCAFLICLPDIRMDLEYVQLSTSVLTRVHAACSGHS